MLPSRRKNKNKGGFSYMIFIASCVFFVILLLFDRKVKKSKRTLNWVSNFATYGFLFIIVYFITSSVFEMFDYESQQVHLCDCDSSQVHALNSDSLFKLLISSAGLLGLYQILITNRESFRESEPVENRKLQNKYKLLEEDYNTMEQFYKSGSKYEEYKRYKERHNQ